MEEDSGAIVWLEISGRGVDISAAGAVLLRWLKWEGDVVEAGQAVARIETRDVYVDMVAPLPGVLRHVVREGVAISIGDIIGRVEASPGVWPPAPRKSL